MQYLSPLLMCISLYSRIEHSDILAGVIVLEEFCKELAAIAFVKYHESAAILWHPVSAYLVTLN